MAVLYLVDEDRADPGTADPLHGDDTIRGATMNARSALYDVLAALVEADTTGRDTLLVPRDSVLRFLVEHERLEHELEETRRALGRARVQVEESWQPSGRR
jgi:hypothetical protein